MESKFIFTSIALILVLFVPNISCAEILNKNNSRHNNIYLSGQYKPAVSVFKNFSVSEKDMITSLLFAPIPTIGSTTINSKDSSSLSSSTLFSTPYTVKFQNSMISFSGTIGQHLPKGLRVEIEGSYESFDVKNHGFYSVNDAHRYLALARNIENKYAEQRISPYSVSNTISILSGNHEGATVHYITMKNNGISIMSIILNGCYDVSLDRLRTLPYVCIGIGVDTIEFFDTLHIKFAYQYKLGISYPIFSKVSLFADGYYHIVKSNQFKNLNTIQIHAIALSPKVTYATATLNINYFGVEIGARFIF